MNILQYLNQKGMQRLNLENIVLMLSDICVCVCVCVEGGGSRLTVCCKNQMSWSKIDIFGLYEGKQLISHTKQCF